MFFLTINFSEYVTFPMVDFFAHVVTVREQRLEKGTESDVIKNAPPALFHNEILAFLTIC